MLPRLILTILVVLAAVAFVRYLRHRLGPRSRPAINAKTVRCAHCNVYFPREDGVQRDGQVYCSRAHADAAR